MHSSKIILQSINQTIQEFHSRKQTYDSFDRNNMFNNLAFGAYLLQKQNLFPSDEQLLAAFLMTKYFVEFPTGQGKTVVIFLLSIHLLLSTDSTVFVFTFNEYLAKRDTEFFQKFAPMLPGFYLNDISDHNLFHSSNVIFTTAQTFSNLYFFSIREKQTKFFNCLKNIILDEIDGIVLDQNQIPIILSESLSLEEREKDITSLISNAFLFSKNIPKNKYIVNFDEKKIFLSNKVFHSLSVDCIQEAYWIKVCLEGELFYKKDIDYIVKNGKIIFIDQITGRINENVLFSNGINLFLSWKESLKLDNDTSAIDYTTIDHLICQFNNIHGISGTMSTVKNLLEKLFNKLLIVFTNKFKLIAKYIEYTTLDEKYNLLKQQILSINIAPIVLIANDIPTAEKIYEFLKNNLPDFERRCRLLHCASEKEENVLIARSGIAGSILITTNLLGRGTDIKIGGDISLFGNIKASILDQVKDKINQERRKIALCGGLHIILWERFKDIRIDLQALGRTARQNMVGTVLIFNNKSINQKKSNNDNVFQEIVQQRKLAKLLKLSNIIFRCLILQEEQSWVYNLVKYFTNISINFCKINNIQLEYNYNLANEFLIENYSENLYFTTDANSKFRELMRNFLKKLLKTVI